MGTQRKAGTSLNDDRQRKLDEMLAAEPFASQSSMIARAIDIAYEVWRHACGDRKGANGLNGLTAGGAA